MNRSSVEWSDRIVDKDGVKYPIYSLTFNPEGSQLLASCGTQILVYNCQTGDLINTLKAHKDTIYALDYSPDGKRFASGGADKTVIIWHSGLEGMLKYQHTEPIQAITHNPLTNHVTSVTSGEFGIWSPDQKSVNKFKVTLIFTHCLKH
jgi:intraflagellar transport protein 122